MRWGLPSDLVGAAATLTSSTAVDADYPLAHLHDGLPTEITRWSTSAQTRLVWDFGAGSPAQTIEGLLVVMHTLLEGASLTIQANAANAWGAPPFSTTLTVPAWVGGLPPNLLADLRATTLGTTGYRYVSLLLPDAGSPGANHAIGEVCWVSQWTAPSVSCAWPVRRSDVRRINVNATSYGVEHIVDRGVRQRRLWPRFAAISDADRALVLDLLREAGASLSWPLVLDTHETTDFHASAEALLVRVHPEAAASVGEELGFYAQTDLQLDLLEVQRGLPL